MPSHAHEHLSPYLGTYNFASLNNSYVHMPFKCCHKYLLSNCTPLLRWWCNTSAPLPPSLPPFVYFLNNSFFPFHCFGISAIPVFSLIKKCRCSHSLIRKAPAQRQHARHTRAHTHTRTHIHKNTHSHTHTQTPTHQGSSQTASATSSSSI